MMRRKGFLSAAVAFGLVFGSPVFWTERVLAQIPQMIRYQGTLTDSGGALLDGPYTLTFRFYDAPTGGNLMWEEIQTGVPVASGAFSVLLGSVTPLNLRFDIDCWLAVSVNGGAELSPRHRVASVPNAYLAAKAEGLVNPVKASEIEDDSYELVPSGMVLISLSGACPAGYTRVAALDGKFLVGGSNYNTAAGGSNTHSHGAGSYTAPSHNHPVPRDGWGVDESGCAQGRLQVGRSDCQGYSNILAAQDNTTGSGGGGSITGTSDSADSRPEFATVILCQKD